MFSLILESLGSTELLFILVMALVFFGPRKLPQLSRKLGKSMAEFRRASEDFKSTWEREVALETTSVDSTSSTVDDRSMLTDNAVEDGVVPTIRTVSPDEQIARGTSPTSEPSTTAIEETNTAEPLQKRDWL